MSFELPMLIADPSSAAIAASRVLCLFILQHVLSCGYQSFNQKEFNFTTSHCEASTLAKISDSVLWSDIGAVPNVVALLHSLDRRHRRLRAQRHETYTVRTIP